MKIRDALGSLIGAIGASLLYLGWRICGEKGKDMWVEKLSDVLPVINLKQK